jgi:hypothetical protein
MYGVHTAKRIILELQLQLTLTLVLLLKRGSPPPLRVSAPARAYPDVSGLLHTAPERILAVSRQCRVSRPHLSEGRVLARREPRLQVLSQDCDE